MSNDLRTELELIALAFEELSVLLSGTKGGLLIMMLSIRLSGIVEKLYR